MIEGGVPVTGVELSQTALSMEVDSAYLLQAEIFPSNATNSAVTWCSCSSDVATVSEKGLIQAKTTGSVKITATTEDGNFSETCLVTIVPKGTLEQVDVESISITSQEETYHLVKMGETLCLNATVMPTSATNQEVVWLSEDVSVATVDTNGTIHPRSEGEVRITATSVAGGKTAEYWVKTVPSTFIEDVVIDLAYKDGNVYQFTATTIPETATGKLVWTSSNSEIMSIDDNGLAIRKKDGLVTITVRAETNAENVADFVKEKAWYENIDWWTVALGIVAFLIGDFLTSTLVLAQLIFHFFIKDDENEEDVTGEIPEDSIENDDEYIEEPTPGPTETPEKPEDKYVSLAQLNSLGWNKIHCGYVVIETGEDSPMDDMNSPITAKRRDMVQSDVDKINDLLDKYEINTKERICAFLATCSIESKNGSQFVEQAETETEPLEGPPTRTNLNAWFDFYRSKYGAKYRGGGAIQLTGQWNYNAFKQWMEREFGKSDSYIMDKGTEYVAMTYPWESAVAFWDFNTLNEKADTDNMDEITKDVNPRLFEDEEEYAGAIQRRRDRYEEYKSKLYP